MKILTSEQFKNGYSLRVYQNEGRYHVEVYNPKSIKVIWSILNSRKQANDEVLRLKEGVLKW